MSLQVLPQFLDDSARVRPHHTAIEEPEQGEISYRDLATLSDQLRDRLFSWWLFSFENTDYQGAISQPSFLRIV